MKPFQCPAAYEGYVRATLGATMAEIGHDVQFREDDEPRVRKLAPVADQFITPDADGTLTVFYVVAPHHAAERLAEFLNAINTDPYHPFALDCARRVRETSPL